MKHTPKINIPAGIYPQKKKDLTDEQIMRLIEMNVEHKPNGCTEWTGTWSGTTPVIHINNKTLSVSRFIYKQKIDKNLKNTDSVTKTCNNTRCVNPDHLVASSSRNSGHVSMGVEHPNAKLTIAKVQEMRRRKNTTDVTYSELAFDYDISMANVISIIKRRTWKHVV